MMRILLVEDEPASADYLATIIRRYLPDVILLEPAENGMEALARMQEDLPDVVVSDVAMPRMNGLELVRALKEQWPLVSCVMISGYQEFDYARTALQHGVVDYLLKPVKPQELVGCLERLFSRLTQERRSQRAGALNLLLRGLTPEAGMLRFLFPYCQYEAALMREFGLPASLPYPFEAVVEPDCLEANGYVLSGRDARERLIIRPFPSEPPLEAVAAPDPNWSLVMSGVPFPIEKLAFVAEALCKRMDETLSATPIRVRLSDSMEMPLEPSGEMPLEAYLDAFQHSGAALSTLYRRIQPLLLAELKGMDGPSPRDVEDALRCIFEDAESYAALKSQVLRLYQETIWRGDEEKGEAGRALNGLLAYLDAHLASPLTLHSIGESFGMSQTTVNRLFRKHLGKSFLVYLTERRLEKAKRLLQQDSNIRIKEVADRVGFVDPLYFSRVFRNHTGDTPTQYATRWQRSSQR